MPVNVYEGMFLLDGARASSNWEESEQYVHELLRKYGSEIVASRQWDDRRLSYPVGPHKKGTYLLTYFKADGARIKEIVADCHINELILRELILKVHPKLVDSLVAQAMSFTPSEDSGPPEDDDRRERRGRRDRDFGDRDRGDRDRGDRDRDRN